MAAKYGEQKNRNLNEFRDPKYAPIFSSLIGREYKLGSYQGDGALDCYGLLRQYITMKHPNRETTEHHPIFTGEGTSLDLDSYAYEYKSNSQFVMWRLIKLLSETCLTVVPEYKRAGDILVLSHDGAHFVGIYTGSSKTIITSPETGSMAVLLRWFDKVEAVYRYINVRIKRNG